MSTVPRTSELYSIEPNNCPIKDFIDDQGDAKVRARIVRKIEHLEKLDPMQYSRPLVDTVEGPIKELRVDQQIRVLFSVERSPDKVTVVCYNAERKKNGRISPALIEQAKEYRQDWVRRQK